ncbi:DUF5994 family protein [Streptomyces violaceoruber]|uniref:DUF5994 family protein n=2 Tax=Streptomyces TaxID=1883 RepID=UPI000D2CB623|nr:DUF5994 family protein [Streptomyces anthocyanicus]PSK52004.1 hypothetical protein B0E38_04880 [Streptomyces sp. 111WW2]GHA31845.1 hypothetical protein GCM10010391_14570 [Streptomyces anthocyanicus]
MMFRHPPGEPTATAALGDGAPTGVPWEAEGVSSRRVSTLAGPPSPVRVLADGGHDSATPSSRSGSVPLRPFTTYLCDGAWWPRRGILAAESPALISGLTERLGPVPRIVPDRAAGPPCETAWAAKTGAVRTDDPGRPGRS